MRFNESALRQLAKQPNAQREGRLSHKAPKEGYKDRWFSLRGNLLFYYRTNEFGAPAETDPVGVLVIEGCDVQIEPLSDRPFVFSIVFPADMGRKHFFSGNTLQQCQEWVSVLECCRHAYLKAELENLKQKLYEKTGRDAIADDLAKRLPRLKSGPSTLQRASAPPQKVKANSMARVGATRRVKSTPKEVETRSTFFSTWEHFQ